jgi:Fe-S-cluster containining protein
MPEPPSPPTGDESAADAFDDDVDTVPQCTGRCCDPVPLPAEDYWAMSRDPRLYKNARYIMNMLIPPGPGPVPRHGKVAFACRHFDRETRRCAAYDRRPAMCREFPETGICGHCGGRFATGAHVDQPEHDGPSAVDLAKLAAMRSLIAMEMPSPTSVRSPRVSNINAPRRLPKRKRR